MNVALRILRITLRYKWHIAGAYACAVAVTAVNVAIPWLVGSAIDKTTLALEGGTSLGGTALEVASLLVAVGALGGMLATVQYGLEGFLSLRVMYVLRNQFYDHVQNLSFGFHDRYATGDLMSRGMRDVGHIGFFVATSLIGIPFYSLMYLAIAAMLFWLDSRLALIAIGFTPLLLVVSEFARRHVTHFWTSIGQRAGELSTVLQQSLTGVRVVKAFAAGDFEVRKFDTTSGEIADLTVTAARVYASYFSCLNFAFLVLTGLVMWYGGSMVIGGDMSYGDLSRFLLYVLLLLEPVRFSEQLIRGYAQGISSGKRLFDIMDAKSPVQESGDAVEMQRIRGHVAFKNVSFTHSDGKSVLKGIDIDAKPGTVVAFLGAQGSGKSSLVNLIPRFYDVSSGVIAIDGKDIRDLTLESLRRNIGIVQQDPFLFSNSIRENIAFGVENAPYTDVVNAAQIAQLDDFVQSLPDGYDTIIGERGMTLSGGQRQRLSIARAMLLDPPMLILDDATSSVDAETEELFRRAMESAMLGRTTFVVAHRLNTVLSAGQIIVLERGVVSERGTHDELYAANGTYRQIYELQLRPQHEMMLEFDVSIPVMTGENE